MGLGSLATIGAQQPDNISVVVLDNESYGETGGQKTHTGYGVNLAAIASACGFVQARMIRKDSELTAMRSGVHRGRGPLFYQVKVKSEPLPLALPPRDGAHLKHRFRQQLLGERIASE